jgi:hypothetical protein
VLEQQLRDGWRVRERAIPISPVMTFTPDGLVLGAGTVLVAADGRRSLKSLQGQEARVLALLAAAYGKAVAPAVLGNIERAVKSWGDGDECLAHSHLLLCQIGLAIKRKHVSRRDGSLHGALCNRRRNVQQQTKAN